MKTYSISSGDLYHSSPSTKNQKWKSTGKHLLLSVIWLIILICFAYPLLIDALFNSERDFYKEYVDNQCLWPVLFSNVGFWGLSVYDYIIIQEGRKIKISIITLSLVAFICIFAILRLTTMEKDGSLWNYPVLTFIPNLALWLHGFFLLILFYIKYLTLKTSNIQDKEMTITPLPKQH